MAYGKVDDIFVITAAKGICLSVKIYSCNVHIFSLYISDLSLYVTFDMYFFYSQILLNVICQFRAVRLRNKAIVSVWESILQRSIPAEKYTILNPLSYHYVVF